MFLTATMAQSRAQSSMVPTHVDVDEEDRNVDVDDYRDIDFTLVIQMFYPFSLQTHPDSFPGKTKLKYSQES